VKLLRTLVTALAAVIVAGTVASAAPPLRAAFDAEPTPEVSVSPEAPQPTDPPGSESTEAPLPSPSQSETSPPAGAASEGASGSPDFSACAELTGLDNAICRHEALLALRPDNPGLQISIARLLEIQAGRLEATGSTEGETSTSAACPGKSCEPHGNGNGQSKH
jgi:hypothetical protein